MNTHARQRFAHNREATPVPHHRTKRGWARVLGVAVAAAAVVSLILLAFTWPTVTSEPKNLPLATVGEQQGVKQLVEKAPEGMLKVKPAKTRTEAVDMIKHREVFGALVIEDSNPEVLIASAASPAVASQLKQMATTAQKGLDAKALAQMEASLKASAATQKQLRSALEHGPEESTAVLKKLRSQDQQQPRPSAAASAPEVTVTDVVPLSADDSQGAGLAIAGFPLTLGGMVGGIFIALAVPSRRLRVAALGVYGVVAGVALVGILQGWFGLIQGSFGLNWLAAGLSVLATAAIINGFVSLIGPAGIAIGAVLTLFIGNPIASISSPQEFLPGAWGGIGQGFVPGATGTLLRNISYFPQADMLGQWLTLGAWAVAGYALILLGHAVCASQRVKALG